MEVGRAGRLGVAPELPEVAEVAHEQPSIEISLYGIPYSAAVRWMIRVRLG